LLLELTSNETIKKPGYVRLRYHRSALIPYRTGDCGVTVSRPKSTSKESDRRAQSALKHKSEWE
jgi:hypothetical protein